MDNPFPYIDLKTFDTYPKFIHTLIVKEYLEKIYKDDGTYEQEIDDKIYKFEISNNRIKECTVSINDSIYDYFLSNPIQV